MNFKGAIFDLDGTLLDSMPVWENLGSLYLISEGRVPEDGLNEILKPMSLQQSARYFQTRYNIAESEVEIIKRINQMIESQYLNTVPLKPSVGKFLDKLHQGKVQMCIVTASDRRLTEAAIRRLGIAKYFKGIITCNEAGIGKDNPEIYIKALKLMDTPIEGTVVFEDSLHAIKSAKAAGLLTAGVQDDSAAGDRSEIEALADFYLNTFDDWEMD